jgi:hypothetical protein
MWVPTPRSATDNFRSVGGSKSSNGCNDSMLDLLSKRIIIRQLFFIRLSPLYLSDLSSSITLVQDIHIPRFPIRFFNFLGVEPLYDNGIQAFYRYGR